MISATVSISSITASASFPNQTATVNQGDVTPPTFSAGPSSANVDSDSFDITATLDEWGTVYSLVQLAETSPPNVATIISTGESAIDTGVGVTISHTGLSASTDYTAYVVAKDDDDNTQAASTEVDVTTISVFDTDAQAYITAASIVNSAEQEMWNTAILMAKGTGTSNGSDLWTNCVQWFVPNSVSLSSSLVSIRFPGTKDGFAVGPPTHSSAGITSTGTEYIRTQSISSDDISSTNAITICLDQLNNADETGFQYGSAVDAGTRNTWRLKNLSNGLAQIFNTTGGLTSYSDTNSSGLHIFTKRADNDVEVWRLSTSIHTDATFSGGNLSTIEDYWMALNVAGSPGFESSNAQRLFYKFNGGFTANMAADFKEVNDFIQTYYSRNITS